MIQVKFHNDLTGLDRLDREGKDIVDDGLEAVADYVVDFIKSHWSDTSPSSPGEPPAVVTGLLDESVVSEDGSRSGGGQFASGGSVQTRYVQVTAPYAEALELGTANMAPRPFVSPALAAAEPEMGKAMTASFKGRFRG